MGEHNVEQQVDEKKAQAFMKALLEDLRALAFMIAEGRVESGVRRIGALTHTSSSESRRIHGERHAQRPHKRV